MEIFLIVVGIFWWTLHRGLLFVRSFLFLTNLQKSGNIDAANSAANSVGYLRATDFSELAKNYAYVFHDGKQLPVIAEARRQGFVNNKK